MYEALSNSVCGLKLRVYEALSYECMRPYATCLVAIDVAAGGGIGAVHDMSAALQLHHLLQRPYTYIYIYIILHILNMYIYYIYYIYICTHMSAALQLHHLLQRPYTYIYIYYITYTKYVCILHI